MTMIEDHTKQLIDILSDCLAKCTACAKECVEQGDKGLFTVERGALVGGGSCGVGVSA